LPKAVEDATRRGLLYAVILKEQNELHHSLTLNILHGTPQGMVQALPHVYTPHTLHPFVHRNRPVKLCTCLLTFHGTITNHVTFSGHMT